MSDAAGGGSAGALMRAARERQGLHIAALAAALKVTPRKLEALEGDRYDELPDTAFTRSLSLAVCRALKIDPAPVLERLPALQATGLAHAGGGLNQPLRQSVGRGIVTETGGRNPLLWGAAALIVLAVVVLALPQGWLPWPGTDQAAAPTAAEAADAADAPTAAAAVAATAAAQPQASTPAQAMLAGQEASAPAVAPAAAAAAAPSVEVVQAVPAASAAVVAGVAVLRASEPSWVEAIDAGGTVLLRRTLQPGETVGLDGRLPLRLKIGNAAGMQLSLRGAVVDLAPSTRDNIARLSLQ